MIRVRTVRQQEIVDSARRIIIADGIEKLTVRGIAGDLKITDGALYRHFKSKNQIISLLIEDIEKTLLETIQSAARQSEAPQDRLKSIFLSHLSYVEQRKGVSFIVINETLSIKDRSLRKQMFGVVNKYLKTIKAILDEGIRAGSFRRGINKDAAAITFLGMVQSMVTLWGLSGYRYALRRDRLGNMFDVFQKGIVSR